MKKLRNIAIYYIVLGLLCGTVFWWYLFGLWRLAVIGTILGVVYLFLRFVLGLRAVAVERPNKKLIVWDVFFYLHPIILIICFLWYVDKPFNQTIVLPISYEGIVVIEYDRKDGQPKEWINTFLGLGGSRLIKVNKNGYAKTQFKVEDLYVPTFGSRSGFTLKGLKVYYENDLNNELPHYFRNESAGTHDFLYEKLKKDNFPIVYTTDTRGDKSGYNFVVCADKKFYKYYYTKIEKEEYNKKQEYPNLDEFILREDYQKKIENLQKNSYATDKN